MCSFSRVMEMYMFSIDYVVIGRGVVEACRFSRTRASLDAQGMKIHTRVSSWGVARGPTARERGKGQPREIILHYYLTCKSPIG